MDSFDLFNISERFMELVNPTSPEKVLRFGERLALNEHTRVIDFGSGFAEPLVLWAEAFGISGIGIEVREYACERARAKIAARGLEERLQIICADAAKHKFQPQAFDVATCIGATFIWGGYDRALQAMKPVIKTAGRLGIGEVYWLHDVVTDRDDQRKEDFHQEIDLLRMSREAGYALGGVVRASQEDWDRYESGNWQGLLHWLEENPDHPEREQVRQHLDRIQEEYLQFGRQNLGWAMYALVPMDAGEK